MTFIRTHCGQLIKLPEEFIKEFDEFLSGALRGQAGETNDICKQDAARTDTHHSDRIQADERSLKFIFF